MTLVSKEVLQMETTLQAISTVGFPIVVAMYSLIRLEKTMAKNTQVIIKLCERLDEDKED